ncbi:MAG TPA: hypothetical protein VFK02_31655, partial [Kofleriaceae bacterium]|nr:hypothetical protein [Kofleriaceae bacterium]
MTPRWTRAPRAVLACLVAAACASGGGSSPAPAGPHTSVHTSEPTRVAPGAPSADRTGRPPTAPARDYPASRRDDVVDQLHGTAVLDPYRWLEDASRPEVKDWMAAQDAYARAHLARLPGRDALAARLAEVFYFDALGAPLHRGKRWFFSHRRKDQEKATVHWREGEHGQDRILLDPNQWSADGSSGLKGWWPSWDGRYVAYNRSEHNADETTLSVIDVATGKLLPDTIPGTKYGGTSWTPDGRGFFYTWVPPPSAQLSVAERPGYAELRYHALGSDPSRDPTVRAATRNPQTFLRGHVSHDGRWLFATIQHGWTSNDIYFKDLRAHQPGWSVLVESASAVYNVDEYRDVFYVHSNEGAPRYRLFAVDPRHPARESWREIVAQSDATLESSTLVGGALALRYLRSAASEIEIHDLQGKGVRKLDLPPLGAVEAVVGLPTDPTAYLTYTSFTEPQVVYQAQIATGVIAPWARVELPVDTSRMTTEQVRYPSKDGTEITMFLVHRKDAVK